VTPSTLVPSAAARTGLGNYMITYAKGTLNVAVWPYTTLFRSQSKAYGQAITLDPTAFTVSGLVGGDTITGVTLTSAGTAANAATAEEHTSALASHLTGVCSYKIAYANGTLNVGVRTLTITAKD